MDFHGNNGSVDGAAPAAHRYCVTGDTLVVTNEGLIPIQELAVCDENDETEIDYIIQSKDQTNHTSKFFNSGKHEIVHIYAQGYELRGSKNHPILGIKDDKIQWLELKDLKVGDTVLLNTDINQISSDKQLVYSNLYGDIHWEDFVNADLFDLTHVLESTKQIQHDFLYEFFDKFAEFNSIKEYQICTSTETVAKQLQILLLTFNIVSRRYSNTIIIDDNYLPNLKANIGIKNEQQLTMFNALVGDKPILSTQFEYVSIDNITYEPEETVYSIRVDSECHSFTANGFINHNTESKLNKLAELNLNGIQNNAIDFKPNFSETKDEPVLLPSVFPHLICNGTSGIAVGYSTFLPSHQLGEVCDAIKATIKNPDITVGQLIEGKLTIKAFTRYMLGEGLEKRQDNFAQEVMSQIAG